MTFWEIQREIQKLSLRRPLKNKNLSKQLHKQKLHPARSKIHLQNRVIKTSLKLKIKTSLRLKIKNQTTSPIKPNKEAINRDHHVVIIPQPTRAKVVIILNH